MMRAALLILALAATPALAQDEPPRPPFDAGLIDACLEGGASDPAACIGAASRPCMEAPEGSSTAAMSWCLGQELEVWDAKLNDSYGRVTQVARAMDADMAALGSAAERQEPLLTQMQRDWIAFRDSACAFERSRWGGGSGSGPAGLECAMTLTAQQYLRLRAYEPDDE